MCIRDTCFRGEIEFGVINQSSSAFSHILGDVSLVVYQIERLASFSAVTDRLGQMTEVLEKPAASIMYSDMDEDGETKLRSRIARGPVARRDWRAAAGEALASAAGALSLTREPYPANGAESDAKREAPDVPRLFVRDLTAVSYTHLTLPTILRV